MGNLISITNLEYCTPNLGAFQISFKEFLYDYDHDTYDGVIIVVNQISKAHPSDITYLHQEVTLWGDQRPIFKDDQVWMPLEWLEQAIEAQHEEVLKGISESWGPYQWEETDEPSYCLLRGRVGYYDAPRYKNLYRKDAMTKV